MYKKFDHTRATGCEEGNALHNFRQINLSSLNLDGLCVCLWEGTKKEMPEKRLRRRLWSVKVHLFQAVNKGLIGLKRLLPGSVGSFLKRAYARWISSAGCAHCVAVHVKTKLSRILTQTKYNLTAMNYRWAIPETILGNSITSNKW